MRFRRRLVPKHTHTRAPGASYFHRVHRGTHPKFNEIKTDQKNYSSVWPLRHTINLFMCKLCLLPSVRARILADSHLVVGCFEKPDFDLVIGTSKSREPLKVESKRCMDSFGFVDTSLRKWVSGVHTSLARKQTLTRGVWASEKCP
jgi:hypothetical protein